MWILPALLAAAYAVNGTVPVQGSLTDADGAPASGSHAVTFALSFATPSGPEVWTETATVAFLAGEFSYVLGNTSPLALDRFSHDATLTVQLESGAPSQPVSVGWAARAAFAHRADTLDGLDSTAFRLANAEVSWGDLADVPLGLDDGDDGAPVVPGGGLQLVGGALALDQTAQDARYALKADLMNADRIVGVPVHDAAKADGRLLAYDAANTRIVYTEPTVAYFFTDWTDNPNLNSTSWLALFSRVTTLRNERSRLISRSGSNLTFSRGGVYQIHAGANACSNGGHYFGLRVRKTNGTAATLAQRTVHTGYLASNICHWYSIDSMFQATAGDVLQLQFASKSNGGSNVDWGSTNPLDGENMVAGSVSIVSIALD